MQRHHPKSGRYVWWRLGGLAIVLAASGCATAPVLETKQFQDGFMAVDSVGQPLLDDLAIAERLQGRQIARNDAVRTTKNMMKSPDAAPSRPACPANWLPIANATSVGVGYIAGFCIEDAGYYSKIGDPPKTQSFRRALAFIGAFAQALSALADGTSATTATAQVQQLAQDAGALAGMIGGASGVGVAIGPAVGGITTAFAPLIREAAIAASVEQQRRVLLEAEPHVAALITALTKAAPALFATLIEQTQNAIEDRTTPLKDGVARIEAYRMTVSDYVILLGRLRDAWVQLVAAVKTPSNPVNLATLTRNSAQIVADAATVRQSLALLRRGPTAP